MARIIERMLPTVTVYHVQHISDQSRTQILESVDEILVDGTGNIPPPPNEGFPAPPRSETGWSEDNGES